MQLIFDDSTAVPGSLRALIGVERFGDIVFQRRSRIESMRELAHAAEAKFVLVQNVAERAALIEQLAETDEEEVFLFCPSNLALATERDSLVTFLRQIRYAPTPLYMPAEDTRNHIGWASMRTRLLPQFMAKYADGALDTFFDQHGDIFIEVRERVRLIDIAKERNLLHFLSGQFDARHFNAIVHDDYTVTKRSRDREKLRREFEFYRLLPPQMQSFLVQPFDFQDDGVTASYRMERLSVPDMALQWVHGALQPHELDRFLAHMFHFLSIRPTRRVDKHAAVRVQDELYVRKVESRIQQLKQLPAYQRLAPLLDNACGGIDALLQRYLDVFSAWRKRFDCSSLAVGHGDPCFSNILYAKSSQMLKLIDPRGATSEDELYTDPYYDVAKLSHSVLGLYDFVNLDKFEIDVDERLGLRLQIDNPPPVWASRMFAAQLARAGFDLRLTRLCEASLFVSMLPLHIDRPRKVLGFAIRAMEILDEISGEKENAK